MDIYTEIEEVYCLCKSLHDSLMHRELSDDNATHNSVLSYIIEQKMEKIYREAFKL